MTSAPAPIGLVEWLDALLWFLALGALALALAPLVTGGRLRRRLESAIPARAVRGSARLVQDHESSRWAKAVTEVERRGVSLKDSNEGALANKLMLAGFPQPYAVRAFVLVKLGLTVTMAAIAFVGLNALGVAGIKFWIGQFALAAIGLYMPNIYVGTIAGRRRRAILNGFPDALDLMLVCVEAGLGVDQAFDRVGAELTGAHPLLSRLLLDLSLELRAGRTRAEALKSLARKTALSEMVSFVALLNQADKLGASIAPALRIYSAEMREARRMRAEEKAARLPVLLSVPIVFFLLPVVVGTVMLPALINIKRNYMGHTGPPASSARAN